jgi:hypothetical protein
VSPPVHFFFFLSHLLSLAITRKLFIIQTQSHAIICKPLSLVTDDLIPEGTDITDGHATYIIRKGRRRQRIDEFGSISLSSIHSKLSNEVLCNENNAAMSVPSPIYPPSMMQPQSRHSIDLGASPRKHILPHNYHPPSTAATNSPRYFYEALLHTHFLSMIKNLTRPLNRS